MDTRILLLVVIASTLVHGCESPTEAPPTTTDTGPPQLEFVATDFCKPAGLGHDAPNFAVLLDGCPQSESHGFDDELATFQYSYTVPFNVHSPDPLGSAFVVTFEGRVGASGSFGVRLADVQEAVFGETATTDPFTVRYISGLGGAVFFSYTIGCVDDLTTEDIKNGTCLDAGPAKSHDEVKFCIDDPTDPSFADAEAVCEAVENSLVAVPGSQNKLPEADISFSPSSPVAGEVVSFDGTSSSDTDGSITGYSWDFGDGSPAGSGATPTHTFGTADDFTVTLTVTDDDGAMGQTSQEVSVTEPPPPNPDPLTVDILGAEVAPQNEECIYYRVVSGGTPPYEFEWRRGPFFKVVVSTGISYLANTGTSSFTLILKAWDDDNQVAADTLDVSVTSSFGFCPSE